MRSVNTVRMQFRTNGTIACGIVVHKDVALRLSCSPLDKGPGGRCR